jgi:hypothetical protein
LHDKYNNNKNNLDLKGRKNKPRAKRRKAGGFGLIQRGAGRNYYYPERNYRYDPAPTEIEKFKTVVLYSFLGLGTATGLFFLGRHFYKKAIKDNTSKKSLDEGDPATYARQLKMAFDNDTWFGGGTDEEMVFKVFNEIPTKAAYQKVQKAYSDLYNNELTSDLESELSSEDYNKVISIISAKNPK